MRYWLHYWWQVGKRAGADSWRVAEPHKGLYGAVTGGFGALWATVQFGREAEPLHAVGIAVLGAVTGVAVAYVLAFGLQFIAAPARLDRELNAEVEKARWHRSETYALMASLLEEIDGLRRMRITPHRNDPANAPFEAAHGAMIHRLWAELKPRVKDHEFYGLLGVETEVAKGGASLTTVKYLLLVHLMGRIVDLMERYADVGGPPARASLGRDKA